MCVSVKFSPRCFQDDRDKDGSSGDEDEYGEDFSDEEEEEEEAKEPEVDVRGLEEDEDGQERG